MFSRTQIRVLVELLVVAFLLEVAFLYELAPVGIFPLPPPLSLPPLKLRAHT